MKSDEVVGLKIHESSLPSWERGLKLLFVSGTLYLKTVAPLVGAWIEIVIFYRNGKHCRVAPLVGAWIEIFLFIVMFGMPKCRSPRGSVD